MRVGARLQQLLRRASVRGHGQVRNQFGQRLQHEAAQVGARALGRLHGLKERHRLIGDVRGRGLLLGLDLVADRNSKEPANEAAEELFYRALDKGLSFKITMGNVLTLSPPLTITGDEMDRAIDILDACLEEVDA